jgi:hypothetical protein
MIGYFRQPDGNATMNRPRTVLLEFDPRRNKLREDKKLSDGLSAVVQTGDALWVANDEP